MITNVKRSGIDNDVRDWLAQCSAVVAGGYSNSHSLDINGSSQYLKNSSYPWSLTVNNFTVFAWVKLDALSGNQCIASNGSLGGQPGWAFFVDGSGVLKLQMRDSSGTNWKQATKSGISTGVWYFVAGTFDEASSTGINVYIDASVGTSGNPTTQNGNYASTQASAVGCRFSGGSPGYYLNGHIDEVVVYWSNTFSSGEVSEAYDSANSSFDWDNHSQGSPDDWLTMNNASDDFTGTTGAIYSDGTDATTFTPIGTTSANQSTDIG
jgi:hypothetical protein